MKIGILTLFHGNENWGGVLQGYALKQVLEEMFPHAQVDILIYDSSSNVVYPTLLKQISQYTLAEIWQKAIHRILKNENAGFKEKLQTRKQLFREFMDELTSNPYRYTDENIQEAGEYYDCLICGSDQVWNPNVARPGFFLTGISEKCRKVAYAASIARDDLSMHERRVMLPLIEKFDAVSVREKTAKNYLNQYLAGKREIFETLDPALLLNVDSWKKLSNPPSVSKPYALSFFFSDSLVYRQEIQKYCEQHGLELKMIPFARQAFLHSDEIGAGSRVYDVGPREFLGLFQNAACVFTDSFHGVVFSIIFQKQFCVFERDAQTRVSKNSRLYDLIDNFNLSDRLVHQEKDIKAVSESPIDWGEVTGKLHDFQIKSKIFLHEAVTGQKVQENKIHQNVLFLKRQECCGCSACVEICPVQCIKMHTDEEGFVRPLVDNNRCTQCGLCVDFCKDKIQSGDKVTYIGKHSDEWVRDRSSSGGLFYALAKTVISDDGVVYGAAFQSNHSVKHQAAGSLDEVLPLMTSKYVQSDLQGIYNPMFEDLKQGKLVLFCGTPCQTAAIKKLAQRKRLDENLLLVDFICHGVTSPSVWQSYLSELGKNKVIKYVQFRNKQKGWHDYHFVVEYEDGSVFSQSHELNAYMNTFLSGMNLRSSCYQCKNKANNYASDITMGDAWKIEKVLPSWEDDRGTTVCITRSQKGHDLLIQSLDSFTVQPVEYEPWMQYNPSLITSVSCPKERRIFFYDFSNMNRVDFWKRYSAVSTKKKYKYYAKRIVKYMGLEKYLRRIL